MSTTAPELRSVGEVSSAGYVRRAFLFETVGITAQLWSEQGGDGREAGVRVEMQRLDEQPGASEYDAVELRLHDPIFRADLFRIDTGAPGNFDRAHYHRFEGRYPGERFFDPALGSDPLTWLAARLSDLDALLEAAGRPELRHAADARRVAQAVPAVVAAVSDLMSLIPDPAAGPA
jgi:hypothetical protein